MADRLLDVWLTTIDGEVIRAGQLLMRGDTLYFRYLPEYLNRPGSYPIDPVNLPRSMEAIYSSRGLASPLLIFDDVLPDSWGLALLSKKHGQNFMTNRLQALPYLESSVVGGLLCLDQGKRPRAPQWIPLEYLEHCFDEVRSFELRKADFMFKYLGITGTSAGGARPKASFIDREKSVWLVKFPAQYDPFPDTVSEVEYAGLEFTQMMGLKAPEKRLIGMADGKALAIRRFDISEINGRNILISLSTLVGGMHLAEIGYEKVAAILRRHLHDPRTGVEQFFKMMLVNWCIVNTDDHLKNISLLWDGQVLRLAPCYDLVGNLWGMDTHTIPINGKNSGIKPKDLVEAAKKMGIRDPESIMERAMSLMPMHLERISRIKGTGQLLKVVERRLDQLQKYIGKIAYKVDH